MKKGILIVLAVAAVAAGVFFLVQQKGIQKLGTILEPPVNPVVAAASSTATPLPPMIASNAEINASGRLVPADFMDLSFQTAGTVIKVLVQEGQKVEKGQLIAQLGDEAQVDYEISQAQLDALNAQKTLDDLYKNAPLQAAQANYDINETQKELEKAIKRRNAMNYPKASQKDIDNAYRTMKRAQDTLKDMDAYAESTDLQVQAAYKSVQKEYDNALANYNWLIAPYTDKEKAEQDAMVNLNQQKLEDLKQKYAMYSKGPDPEEVSIAEARVSVIKSQLALAEAKREKLQLAAPFSGIIVNMTVKAGQTVNAGQAILTLADVSRWHIETEDLTELGVTRIKEGAKAVVKFDALPGETFDGKVIAIKNYGVVKKGDITYTAVIEIENTDPRLRWNMTSPITILTK